MSSLHIIVNVPWSLIGVLVFCIRMTWLPKFIRLQRETKFARMQQYPLVGCLSCTPLPLTTSVCSHSSSSDLGVGLLLLAICYKQAWVARKTISNFAKDATFFEVDQSDFGELFESHAGLPASEEIREFSQLTITEERTLPGWWNDRNFKRERFEF